MTQPVSYELLSDRSYGVNSLEVGVHVKTEFRINLYRFGQAVILDQAFLHSDALTFSNACVCVHLLVLTYIHTVLVNAVFVDLSLKQLQYRCDVI